MSSRTFVIPTDGLEGDGTLEWEATTMVVVEVVAGNVRGIGWTYASAACRDVIEETLAHVVLGSSALSIAHCHEEMVRACRNFGRPGVVSCAISAVDIALWDCKARLLGLPLSELIGRYQDSAPIYGSGGFTTYDETTARAQLEQWVHQWAIPRVKIKIGESWGSCERRDVERTELAREAIGPKAELYVDANGAYTRKQAIRVGRQLDECAAVTWLEEPVSSDDLIGLHEVRDQVVVDVAAGEYGYDETYFARMVAANAVDCLQVDVTRCGGYTSWLRAAALAHAHGLDVSAHCAPNLHAHVAVCVPNLRHIEYFHDHHRIETSLFDGALSPMGGNLQPTDALGHGMTLKESDAARWRCA
ncbi:MAG TPA: enolase C-terminal domain-like protein [Acidimicrobiales bacterium]|nr:enolase C-terminal domain-like protein [Acidimicrobiales bacterium]